MIKKPNLHNSWSFSFFQKKLLTKLANLAKNGFWKFEKPPNRQNGGFWAVFVRFLGVFCGFSFYLLYIDESHIARSQSRVLLLKNDKNRTKTAQNMHKNRTKMPYWRFGAFPDFKIPLFAQSSRLVCKNHPNNNKNAKTAQNRTKPAKNLHIGGLALFKNFVIHILLISRFGV